jgi:lipid A ethanolaminephosphotransferase
MQPPLDSHEPVQLLSPIDSTRRRSWTFRLTSSQVVVAASALWTLAFNGSLFAALRVHGQAAEGASWGVVLALVLGLVAIHILLLGVVAHRAVLKPLVVVGTIASAAAVWFMSHYGVVLDPAMLRNALHTDRAELFEVLNAQLIVHLLAWGALPLLALTRVELLRRPLRQAVLERVVLMAGAVLALVVCLWWLYQPLAAVMRQDKSLRYRITPANLVWSTSQALARKADTGMRVRAPIGQDAKAGPSWTGRKRPLVVVLVVGETARAANWGLNRYARPTTPELAQLGVRNFTQVQSCGTDTEASLPCMFAPVGRRQYDEARISSQESLLHVLARARVQVHWRDNQSGCKGVCEGLPNQTVDPRLDPALCDGARCLDKVLTQDLPQRLQQAQGTQLWVLHMLGNHGPSYFRRYPPQFARFTPDCRHDNLARCSQQEVVNAYDNALLYTDHLLAETIRALAAASEQVDSALLYVSDHGESLGEQGLYLHGLPYAIAPQVQKHVPMVWWHSKGFEQASGLAPPGCLDAALSEKANAALSHDHLFHTLLGALDVHPGLHQPNLDLTAPCRRQAP